MPLPVRHSICIASKMNIDLATIGRELKTSTENIQSALNLLDEGNTIPFITRFRKDQTGGLTEEQLLTIKSTVAKMRALAERKAFVVKSIESQGKLTDKLTAKIEAASSSRILEDVYHPFKPRKQTLATTARQNGLEPLALDIFEGREPEKDLASRATDFVRVDKNLSSVDDVIAGVGHLLAEKFSETTPLRDELRKIISGGNLTTKLIEIAEPGLNPKAMQLVRNRNLIRTRPRRRLQARPTNQTKPVNPQSQRHLLQRAKSRRRIRIRKAIHPASLRESRQRIKSIQPSQPNLLPPPTTNQHSPRLPTVQRTLQPRQKPNRQPLVITLLNRPQVIRLRMLIQVAMLSRPASQRRSGRRKRRKRLKIPTKNFTTSLTPSAKCLTTKHWPSIVVKRMGD